MGTTNSKNNTTKNTENLNHKLKTKQIDKILDYIATYYILTSDFQTLTKLYDNKYCSKLILISANIMEKYFNKRDITFLYQRIKEDKTEKKNTDVKTTENVQSTEYTENPQFPLSMEDAQDTQVSQDTQDTQDTQETQVSQVSQDTQDTQDIQDTQDTLVSQDTQDAKDTQDTQDAQDTHIYTNTEDTENKTNILNMENLQKNKTNYTFEEITDKFVYFTSEDLNRISIKNNLNKKNICLSIAKFYIKIAHVFAAIIKTINPIYTYTNENGEQINVDYKNKKQIPKNTKRNIYKFNLCDKRIKELQGQFTQNPHIFSIPLPDYTSVESFNTELFREPQTYNYNPSVCSKKQDIKNIIQEPGIPELEQLYYDEFDFETKTFNKMSDKSKILYQNDLKLFYYIFSNDEEMPPTIKRFSDIKMLNVFKICENIQQLQKQKIDIEKNTKINDDKLIIQLYKKYADSLKKMIINSNKNRDALLEILNYIFVYFYNPITKKREITINPLLNENILEQLIIKTRKYIVQLYITCEYDYLEIVKIFETIVEYQILKVSKMQIDNLEQKFQETISMENI